MIYILLGLFLPASIMLLNGMEKSSNRDNVRFKLRPNYKRISHKNESPPETKPIVYDTSTSEILYKDLQRLHSINKLNLNTLVCEDPLLVYLLRDNPSPEKFNFILAITTNNSNVLIKQEYIDSFFNPYININAYSNPEQYKAINSVYKLLTLFEKKKLKINRPDPNNQSTILNRYLYLYWRIIKANDPIISLCINQPDFKLNNNTKNIITDVLRLALTEHLKQKMKMTTKLEDQIDINNIIELTFSPLEEPVKQAALILNQFRIVEANKEAPYTLNPYRYFEEASVTGSSYEASPKQCFERMDETFKNNKDLVEMFK